MRPSLLIPAFLFLLLIFSSCTGPNGPDGKKGEAFLTVTSSDGLLYAYIDDNASRPGMFNLGQPYRVSPNTYSFAYESRYYYTSTSYYYTLWSGTYQIWIHNGEKGGEGKIFWQKGDAGKDGVDSYLTLLCNYTGYQTSRINKTTPNFPPTIADTISTVHYFDGTFGVTVIYHLDKFGHVNNEQ
jgi:hypothetical protein